MHDDARAMLSDLPVFRFLPPEARQLVIDSCVPVSYSFGQSLVREGEDADAFFVLVSGQARVIKKGENGQEISLNVLRAGESFGEMALLQKGARTATVRASGDVDAFRLDASIFHAMLESSPEIRSSLKLQSRQHSLRGFFRSFQPFAQLAPAALELMLRELEPLSVAAGDIVIRQGDPPGAMYVVEEGRLRVFLEEAGSRRYVGYIRKGDIFGEVSLFKGERRAASVEAVSPCRLLRLTEETYAKLLAYPVFKRRIEERISQYDYRTIARVPLDFDQEVLPAEATVHEKVSPGQVDHDERTSADEAAGPFASADGYFIKRTKKIRRVPFVRQIDETDCGAASLAIVCRHFGRAVSLARIRQLVHTSLDGASPAGCAQRRGSWAWRRDPPRCRCATSRACRSPPSCTGKATTGWCCTQTFGKDGVRIADPAIGLRRIGRAEFALKWTGYAALFDYTQEFDNAPEGKTRLGWLWPFFRPFWRIILQALALAGVLSALQMVLPVLTQVIVDRVLVEQDVALLHILLLTMIGVLVFTTIGMIVQRYLLSFAAVRIDAATLDFLTRQLLNLPMAYFSARRTGDIRRRLEGIRRSASSSCRTASTGSRPRRN